MRWLAAVALAGTMEARQVFSDLTTPVPVKPGDTVIAGFIGGWEPWNDERRGVRKLAHRLRGAGVHVDTIENHQSRLAVELIRKAFDFNQDGRLDASELDAARVILYGQSLGGAAVARVARQLDSLGVPVRLVVLVDSVGRDDSVIPANVAAAVNFYQRESWPVVGEPAIRAADPSRTRILGSFRYHYRGKTADTSKEPLYRRIFGRSHLKMELDPELWARVEEYIRKAME
ncbi:MAG: hypothetical protein ACRD96_27515 [Bryobacteraceae bacterium]